MTDSTEELIRKTRELETELRELGLWKKDVPPWVQGYNHIPPKADFAQWLQFVFIPNHLQKVKPASFPEKSFITLNAIKYFGDDVKKGRLLGILIEIDALL